MMHLIEMLVWLMNPISHPRNPIIQFGSLIWLIEEVVLKREA